MIKQLSNEQLQHWQKTNKDFQLIDVREVEEHHAYNIGGTLIPLSDLLRSTQLLALDKPIVFYCKRGIRSQLAIQKLIRAFPNGDFYNLTSGIGLQL